MSTITITNDTKLKWVARQGMDSERKNITLDTGELGYTTDHKRLFVGDGTTSGGFVVGNTFKGSNADITLFNPSEIGDSAIKSDSNEFYILTGGTGLNFSDWRKAGVFYTSDNTITISPTNQLSVNVGALSGFTITPLYARYSGVTTDPLSGMKYSKNISYASRLGVGHYTFGYSVETSNLIPQIQIYGNTPGIEARITSLSATGCTVEILSGISNVDAEIFLNIIR